MAQIRAQRWMQSLLELQQSAGSSLRVHRGVKTDLFPDEIYVFTPEGRIMELPAGATPAGLRLRCTPTSVTPASAPGSTATPIRSAARCTPVRRWDHHGPGARPNAAWLNFVVTTKARSKIRQFLKNLRAPKSPWCWAAACSTMPSAPRTSKTSGSPRQTGAADTKHENLQGLLADVGAWQRHERHGGPPHAGDELPPEEQPKPPAKKMPIKGPTACWSPSPTAAAPSGDAIIAHISRARDW